MAEELECAWCGRRFPRPHRKGPRPKYCSASHRQRAHEARGRDEIRLAFSSHQSLAKQLAESGAFSSYRSLSKQLAESGALSSYQSLAKQLADMPLLVQMEGLAVRVIEQAPTGDFDEDLAGVLDAAERDLAVKQDPAAVLLVVLLALVMWRKDEISAAAMAAGAEVAETAGMLLAALQVLVNRHPTIGGLIIVLSIAGLWPRRTDEDRTV